MPVLLEEVIRQLEYLCIERRREIIILFIRAVFKYIFCLFERK